MNKEDKKKIQQVEDVLDGIPRKLTNAQIELGAKYLAMSNICTLDRHKKDIKDLASMKRAVEIAWGDAVTGFMEGEEGGYDDKNETKAINGVEAEIRSFRTDLKAGGERARYWIEMFKKEVPFFLTDPSISTHIKITAKKYEGDGRFSWAVFRSDRPAPCYTGLGKSEVAHYKKLVEKYIKSEQSR